jgi:DNA-binding GntR family transcriptional regulator
MSGLFVPGQVFSLRKLAAHLGTSPMPVRESLSRLVAANALEELPNRSVRVPKLNHKDLVELFEMRILIEGAATRIACKIMTEATLKQLDALNDVIITAHGQGDMAGVLKANQKFHFMIYRQAESNIIMPLVESLWLRSGPTMYYSLNKPGLWNAGSHGELIQALSDRDGPKASKAMVKDIRLTGDYLISMSAGNSSSGPLATLANLDAETLLL